jgi:transcriptional regulator with XRE-family HTH domain
MITLNRFNAVPTKPSRFSGEVQGGLAPVARRLRSRMSELGLNQTELAARCILLSQDLFPDGEHPNITRERIAKILMNCRTDSGRSAARVISYRELRVLATVLQVSPEWLSGRAESRDPVLWDPLAEPHRAQHILHLINDHEERASEVLVWAEYLICSLETPEFMHKHHDAIFGELDALGAYEEKRRLVQIYDSIGNARRKRLLDARRKRRKLVQLVFASDLQRIAEGTGEYAGIRRDLRRDCLENLHNLLSEPSLGVELIVINDEGAARLKSAFRDYDSVGVFDESLVLWRYHSGRVAWSESREHTRLWRRTLVECRDTSFRAVGEVLNIVDRLAASAR